MAIVRILHLSDLHLAGTFWYKRSRHLNVYDLDAFSALAEVVCQWRDSIDAILVSGDIAATGCKKDLSRSIDLLSPAHESGSHAALRSRKRTPTRQSFDFSKPIILLPGNHDRYANMSGWPGKRFDKYFSSFWKAGIGGVQTSFLPYNQPPVLAVICADFSLEKPSHSSRLVAGGHWGQGKVYEDRLANLVEETCRVSESCPGCAILWMIHFAPKFENYKALDDRLCLLESDNLIQEAEKYRIKYILCGHTHEHADYMIRGTRLITVHCAGSSACIEPRKQTSMHLRLIEIEDGEIARMRSMTYCYNPD
ncbi:MAG: metallophosphoesterase, partial [Candidatus Methanoperedens sp.]